MYYILHKKIDKLREEFKQCEMELDNTLRGQMNEKNEELQRILNNTHAMLLENQNLVNHLQETVVKKTELISFNNVKINFVKDDGKNEAAETFQKLMHS